MNVATSAILAAQPVKTKAKSIYVAQGRVSGASVVCADHPVIGSIYWQFVSNADCNAPDYYGLTTNLDQALRIKGDWRKHERYNSPWKFVRAACIYAIAKDYGITRAEVRAWLNTDAKWESVPAPDKLYWFAGMNGFWGDTPEWSEDPFDAMEFSADQIPAPGERSDDLDVEAARARGTFVLKEEAVAAYTALQAALPQPRSKPPAPECFPFSLLITRIVDTEEYACHEIHYTVSGSPSTDDVEALVAHIIGDDDDHDYESDPNQYDGPYDPIKRTGHWCAVVLHRTRHKVGDIYWWRTTNRDIFVGSDARRQLAMARVFETINPPAAAEYLERAKSLAHQYGRLAREHEKPPGLIAGEPILLDAWRQGAQGTVWAHLRSRAAGVTESSPA